MTDERKPSGTGQKRKLGTKGIKGALISNPNLREEMFQVVYMQANALLERSSQQPEEGRKAAALFLKAAQIGHLPSQEKYASLCKEGRGVAQDDKQAADWYEKAAEQGSPEAQYHMADLLAAGQGRDQNEERAAEYYEKAANQKLTAAMMKIAFCYRDGRGVKQNAKTALAWFQKVVGKHPSAPFSMGEIYATGYPGVEKNRELAKKWYTIGATGKEACANSACRLGSLADEENDPISAVKWHQKADEGGHLGSTCELGKAYLHGKGVAQDSKEAERLYTKAAASGFVEGSYWLGYMLFYGEGAQKNESKGVAHFQQAAAKNNVNALLTLASLNFKGVTGIPQNKKQGISFYENAFKQRSASAALKLGKYHTSGIPDVLAPNQTKAFSYFQKAAEWENAEGMYLVAKGYALGHGVSQSNKDALVWLKKAEKMGSIEAALALGYSYMTGWMGVQKNQVLALKHYRIAADQGNSQAAAILANSYQMGNGVEKNEVTAVSWYQKAVTAKEPSPEAFYNLAGMYAAGEGGLTKNKETASDYFLKAAELGAPVAVKEIGLRLLLGLGVTQNVTEGIKWQEKLAATGDDIACLSMGAVYATGFFTIEQNEQLAERYLRRAAAEGNSSAFLQLGFLIGNGGKNQELADYLIMGSTVSSKSDQATEKKEEQGRSKLKSLYDLLKRFAKVRVFMKQHDDSNNLAKLDKIYEALEKEFDHFSPFRDEKATSSVSEFETNIKKIERDLVEIEQAQANLKKADVKSDSASDEEEEAEEAPDFGLPAPAPADSSKDSLPPAVVALDRELIRLGKALDESLALADKTPTVENLTNQREGLLAIMGRIYRHIAEKIDDKSVGKYSALYDKNAQRASNYLWHHDNLSTPITSDNLAQQATRVAAICRAAADMKAHFDQKIQIIKEDKEAKDFSLGKIDSAFLREILNEPRKDFDPDAQVAHYKTVSANASFRKRGNNVLANEKWLRLVAMTESAYAQIRNTNPQRYRREQLWREHNGVKQVGKWIRHPNTPRTAEDLTRIVQKKQRDYKRAQQFPAMPWSALMPEGNLPVRVESKTETKGDAKRPLSSHVSALRGSPAHSGSTAGSAGAAAGSSAGSAAAPSSAPKGLA